jgi:hypothetical protein
MLKARILSALTLLFAVLGTAFSAEAAPKKNVDAIHADCFKQANEAAGASAGSMTSGATASRNAAGYSAYRDCARKNGIRP